jgi:hypothetical protein
MQISFLYTFLRLRLKDYYNISSGKAGGFQQEDSFASEESSGEAIPRNLWEIRPMRKSL